MSEEMKAGIETEAADTAQMPSDTAVAPSLNEAPAKPRQKRMSAEEKERAENEERQRAAREKRLASLAYAENYRQKLREEQERRQAAREAKRAARAEAAARRAEEEERLRLEMNNEAALDAERRNAESDELLRLLEEKRERDRLALEEAARAPKPEVRKVERDPESPIIISEDGRELLPAVAPTERPDKKDDEAALPDNDYDDLPTYDGVDLSVLSGLGDTLGSENADINLDKDESNEESEAAPEASEDETVPEEPTKEADEEPEESAIEENSENADEAPKDEAVVTPETDLEDAQDEAANVAITDEVIDEIFGSDPTTGYESIDLSALDGLGDALASESVELSSPEETPAPEEVAAAEEAVESPEEPSDEAVVSTEDEAPEIAHEPKEEPDTATAPVEETAADDTREEKPVSKEREPIDFIISIPGSELIAADKPKAMKKPVKKVASAPEKKPAEEEKKTDGKEDSATAAKTADKKIVKKVKKTKKIKTRTAPKPTPKPAPEVMPKKEPKVEAEKELSALEKLLMGYGTYELVTKKADFDGIIEAKKSAPVKLSDEDKVTADNSLPENPDAPYDYAAGFIYTYEDLGLVDEKAEKKKKKAEKKAKKSLDKKNKKRAKYGLAPLGIAAAAVAVAELCTSDEAIKQDIVPEDTAPYGADEEGAGALELVYGEAPDTSISAGVGNEVYSEDNSLSKETEEKLARIAALELEREALVAAVRKGEELSAAEIRTLSEKEHLAKLASMEVELSKKEADYEKEIAALNARLAEVEKTHAEKRSALESSITDYESGNVTYGDSSSYTKDGLTVTYSDRLVYPTGKDTLATYDDIDTEKRALAITAGAAATGVVIAKLNKRELRRRLAKASKREEKLIRTSRKLERKRKLDTPENLTAKMDVTRELLESYVQDLSLSVAAGSKKHKKKYSRKVAETAGDYNRLIDSFAEVTNTDPPRVERTIAEDIIAGDQSPKIPIIEYTYNPEKKHKLTKAERKERDAEQLQLLKDEKRNKKDEKIGKRQGHIEDAAVVTESITASMASTNLATIKARIKYRESAIKYDLSLAQYHFNEETRSRRRDRADKRARLSAMKRDTKKLLKMTKKNDKRYALVMTGEADTSKVKNAVDRERAELLRQRIISLSNQRNAVNENLIELYYDSGNGKKKNTREKIAKLRIKAAKRSFRSQMSLFKKSRKLNVELKLKEEIWGLMNEKIDLEAYLAECKFRKKTERPKADAKRKLKREIKNTKKSIKYTENDIYRLMRQAKVRQERRGGSVKKQVGWVLILMLIVAAVILAIVFKDAIINAILGLFQKPTA